MSGLMQVYGLCLGLFVGALLNCACYAYIVYRTPWEKVSGS